MPGNAAKLGPFVGGLNNKSQAGEAKANELVEMVNFEVTTDESVTSRPPLEVIKILPKDYFGFELLEMAHIQKIAYQLNPSNPYKNLQLEVSSDGSNWSSVKTEEKKEIMQANVQKAVKFIRVKNNTSENLNVKIILFNAEIK